MNGNMRFGLKSKLGPRYVRPFEIMNRVGGVAHKLALSPALAGLHNVFHVSMLRKFISHPNHIAELEPLEVNKDLSYEEHPVRIVDTKEQEIRHHIIRYIKIQWSNHTEQEAT